MLKVLMIGPGRDVRGGISTVVNGYYEAGLDRHVKLKYIATMEDGAKVKKLFVAIAAFIHYCMILKSYDIVHVHISALLKNTIKKNFHVVNLC